MITKRIVGVVESAKKEFDLNKSKTGFKGSQEELLMDASKELLTFKANYNEKLEDIVKYVRRVDRLAAHINDKIENSEQVMRVESEKVFSDCDTTRWLVFKYFLVAVIYNSWSISLCSYFDQYPCEDKMIVNDFKEG